MPLGARRYDILDAMNKVSLIAATIVLVVLSFLLIAGLNWPNTARHSAEADSALHSEFQRIGHALGYEVFEVVTLIYQQLGLNGSYENILGAPLMIALTVTPVIAAAMTWSLATLLSAAVGLILKRRRTRQA